MDNVELKLLWATRVRKLWRAITAHSERTWHIIEEKYLKSWFLFIFYVYFFYFSKINEVISWFIWDPGYIVHSLRDPGTKNNFFLVVRLPLYEKSRTRLYFLRWYPRKPAISSSMNTLLSLLLWSDNFYSAHLHWRHTLIYN